MKRHSRRRILTGAAGALACGVAAGVGYRRPRGPGGRAAAPDSAVVDALVRLMAAGPGLRETAELGRQYLAAFPDPAPDAVALSREILPTPAARRAFLAAGDERRRCAVEACVAADFAAGRVAVVDGWVLSQTEAALCGIIARV